jgi:DNA-binding SARP family transcriptional activator
MRLFLFDGFGLHEDDQHVTLPPQAQRLIAFVALRRTVRRDEVHCALWPDISDERASARLRTTLWRLRAAGRGVLTATNGQLSLAENTDVDVRNWTALALQVIDQPSTVAALDLSALRQCGDLLPGWYEDWVLLERERARQLQLHVLEIVADQLIGLGRLAAALEFATRALHMEQLRESAYRLVIRVHLAEGNVCEARRQFERCRRTLHNELGVRPSDQLRDLIAEGIPAGDRDHATVLDGRAAPADRLVQVAAGARRRTGTVTAARRGGTG